MNSPAPVRSTSAPGLFVPVNQDPAAFGSFADPDNGFFTIDGNNNFRPYDFGTDVYNFGPLNYYQRPDDRYTAGLFAHYDMNEHATAYTEFMFMNDKTVSQVAPSGAFFGSNSGQPPFYGNYVVNCDNPLLSASQVNALCNDPAGQSATRPERCVPRHRPAQCRRWGAPR